MKLGVTRSFATSSSFALAVALAVPAAIALPGAANAQSVQQTFNIPAGDLAAALSAFSAQTGVQLVYSSDLVAGKQSSGVSGTMSAQDALGRLLAGTGLSARVSGNSATLVAIGGVGDVAPVDGERVLGTVRVEGDQGGGFYGRAGQAAGVNGINGSRDITATEGTKSFTTGAMAVGSKAPQAPKDTIQSVSVLTKELMDQKNITDYNSALRQMPGLSFEQGQSSLEMSFYSRGFRVEQIQIDGGAPRSIGQPYFPLIDMSMYDHVELLRGAAGYNGYGNPGGTVNLVRKKPLDHGQVTLEGQIGSWKNYRTVFDATSPLALNGALRGRVIMTYQNNHYFYDTAKDKKTLIYGVAELDVTPTTLFTAGVSYNNQDSLPWMNGLPRYTNGNDLKLPRSTALLFDWNSWKLDATELFGGLEQRLGGDWTAKLNVTYNISSSDRKIGVSYGSVDPTTLRGAYLGASYYSFGTHQLTAEGVVTGSFTIFGQRQEVTLGVNRSSSTQGGNKNYDDPIQFDPIPYRPYPGGPSFCNDPVACPYGNVPPIDVLNFDRTNPIYSEPPNPLVGSRTLSSDSIAWNAYLNLRLTAFNRLHFTTGLRYSRTENTNVIEYICSRIPQTPPPPWQTVSCYGKNIGDVRNIESDGNPKDVNFSWPPSGTLSFDFSKSLTAYLGYTDIYISNTRTLSVGDHKPIPPITGGNWEAGFKWSARDGRFNLSLSAYRIKQNGFARFDSYEEAPPGFSCCFISEPNQTNESTGADLEATGEISRGWQLAASYTYNNNEQVGSTFGAEAGKPFTSIMPHSVYKLWTSYDFGAAGHGGRLAGLTVSAGVNGQSSAYYAGYTCVHYNTALTDPIYGTTPCMSYDIPDYVPYNFVVPSRAIASARIDYRFSKTWSLAANVENIFDKTYYETVGGGVSGSNWYGAPRSLTFTISSKL